MSMIQIQQFNPNSMLSNSGKSELIEFLYTHLDEFGDNKSSIEKAIDYAMSPNKGGLVLMGYLEQHLVCATVINATGMDEYIPANILVYIATHADYRGKGLGKELMQTAIKSCSGGIALHVEPNNPAKFLYEKLGFTNKYLEMRLVQ